MVTVIGRRSSSNSDRPWFCRAAGFGSARPARIVQCRHHPSLRHRTTTWPWLRLLWPPDGVFPVNPDDDEQNARWLQIVHEHRDEGDETPELNNRS